MRCRTWWSAHALLATLCLLNLSAYGQADISATGRATPGKAGYALVFHDSIVMKKDFKDFPTTEMTFEAWISTSDYCHSGAIMSYAVKTDKNDLATITRAANHFVIFDVKNIIACHDFEFIDIIPDYMHLSCHGHYNHSQTDFNPTTGKLVSREGAWHHLAVTWSASADGETLIYIDGSPVGRAKTGTQNPIARDGAFMLGGEQDCYGGCTDPKQGFYGLMDEVRIWNVVRTQDQIASTMRLSGDLPGKENLVAYWKFDDPGSEGYELYGIVADSSGHQNDLDLLVPPTRSDVTIEKDGKKLTTGALTFKNNYALNPNMKRIPSKDVSVEFWARTGTLDGTRKSTERYAEFLSFAALKPGDGDVENDGGFADAALFDDAIRIERYLTEYNETQYLKNTNTSTFGSISIHINSNRQGNGKQHDNWIDFDTDWTDDKWHHIAMTWKHSTGETRLYFDGKESKPFWRAQNGHVADADPALGGVSNKLAQRTQRSTAGSLVLGQNQECYAGCFSPSSSYDGSLANLRIWSRVLSKSEINTNMFMNEPSNDNGLALSFIFTATHVKGRQERNRRLYDSRYNKYHLELGSVAPSFQFSTVPLTDTDGRPFPMATPGNMGYALELNDKQLLILRNFLNFPTDAITVEFWMWSTDGCRQGVPFSYAHGEYQTNDNTFLIFNYNDWGIAVVEDEGGVDDHNAGFGSTDGRWHHIAVTWESRNGHAVLYDNAIPQWRVSRAKGKKIPQGGTLVIGREQDCLGGCFDSAPGAAGDVQPVANLEYGPQDFYGMIEEVRIWKRARSDEEILEGMIYDKDRGSGFENNYLSSSDPDLVAWWKFDEGTGFTVKDETGHGNTLRLTTEPKWVVPRWVETCGDGILEATEGCDDGNRKDGDGCSSMCEVEPGYECSVTSPTKCFLISGRKPRPSKESSETPTTVPTSVPAEPDTREDPKHPEPPAAPKAPRTAQVHTNTAEREASSSVPAPEVKNKKKGGRSGVANFFIVVFVFAVIGFIAFITYKKRETIYEYAPGLRTIAGNAQDRINAALGRGYHRYDLAAVDPEEAYVSPGFVDSQPPAANRASGVNVPYEPIGDSASRPSN